jgi:L-ribulokinase
MGTSTCHLILGERLALAEGMCGVVEDGIVPGFYGYETGQNAVGDIFGWFARTAVPPDVHERARAAGVDVLRAVEDDAARLRPGESGLVALDWWNGNRSILVDTDLSGLLVGATLATTPGDIYRSLLESTVFGTRRIIESLEDAGVPVERIVACGGLPDRSRLLMQLTADITGREVAILLPLALAAIVLGVMPAPALDSMLRPVQALRTPAPLVQPQRPLAAAPAVPDLP